MRGHKRAPKLEEGQRYMMTPPKLQQGWGEMRGNGEDNVNMYYKPKGAIGDKTGLQQEDFLIVL